MPLKHDGPMLLHGRLARANAAESLLGAVFESARFSQLEHLGACFDSSPQKALQLVGATGRIFRFTLPNREHFKTHLAQFSNSGCVARDVSLKLLSPEPSVARRRSSANAPRVSMPIAAVNEDRPCSCAVRNIG